MSEMEWKGEQVLKMLDGISKRVLMQVAQDLKAKSIDQAPVDTGDLRGSCNVKAKESESTNEVSVSYGTEYALRQHEDTSFRHPQGGRAKYLEDPYKDNVKQYEEHIAEAIKNALK